MDDFRADTSIQDIRPLVKSAIGSSLVKVDLDDTSDHTFGVVAREVLSVVTSVEAERSGFQEHCLACTLFGFDVPPFEIGVARFETRHAWLARRLAKKEIGKITASRVSKIWNGERLRNRKSSWESIFEREIIDLVGNCRYVISVSTDGLAPHFAQEKALVITRIALTAIALLWRFPSKRLSGFNLAYDREVRSQISLTIDKGRLRFSHRKTNLTIDGAFSKNDWLKLLESEKLYFTFYEEIINFIIKNGVDDDRNKTLRKIFHAILWFHEGCRESSPLIATVKYGACMDSLSSGRGERAILTVFDKVLGWKKSAAVFSDGMTLETAVLRIYKQGRSRTIHGNNNQSHIDWSTIAARAEQLARDLLMGCIEWAAEKDLESDIAVLSR